MTENSVPENAADQQLTVAQRRELAPVEGLAAALQMQAEVLRRLHEEQKKLGEEVRDRSRSELMLRSAQALNDSFTAMRQSQEALLNNIEGARPGRKRLLVVIAVGFLVLAAAITFSVLEFGRDVSETMTRELASDSEHERALGELETRLKDVEGREREVLLAEVQKLRASFEAGALQRARLERERDEARTAVTHADTRVQDAQRHEQDLNERLRQSDVEMARLTERALADQKLLAELNKALETARAALPNPVAILNGGSGIPVGANEIPKIAPRTADAALIVELNSLLTRHSGYEKYIIRTANGVDDAGLLDVVLEVRGRDDSLLRVVESERLNFTLTARTRLLELGFVRGTVTFHQGVARPVRSPFFNERYQLVLVGVETQAWNTARIPFAVAAGQ